MTHIEQELPVTKDVLLKDKLTQIFEDPLLPQFLETMGEILSKRNQQYRDNQKGRNLAHLATIGDETATILKLNAREKETLIDEYNTIILCTAERFKREKRDFRHNTMGEEEDGTALMFLQVSQAIVRFHWQEFVDDRDTGFSHFVRFVGASLYDPAAQIPEATYYSVPTSALVNPETGLFPEHLFSVPDRTDEIDFSNLGDLLSSLNIPESSKKAFLLQFVSKKKIKEIADILGGTNEEIKRSIRTVKNALKKVLKPQSNTHTETRHNHAVNPIWLDVIEKTTYYQNLLQQKRFELPPFVEKVFRVSLEAIEKGAATREQIIEFVGLHPEFKEIKAETIRRTIVKAAEALTHRSKLQNRPRRSAQYPYMVLAKKAFQDREQMKHDGFTDEEIKIIRMYYIEEKPLTMQQITEELGYRNNSVISRKLMRIKNILQRR